MGKRVDAEVLDGMVRQIPMMNAAVESKYISRMCAAVRLSKDDEETAHDDADDILCELLVELGCVRIVGLFEWRSANDGGK